MRLTTFGSYDFTSAGIGVLETQIGLGRVGSSQIGIPFADGAYDGYGTGQSPKVPGTLSVRLEVRVNGANRVDDMLDSFLKYMHTGQQWLRVLLDDGTTYRRALAKCVDTQYALNRTTKAMLPISAQFEIVEPYWYADMQMTDTFSVSATPTACDLNNLGTAPLVKAILRFVGTCNRPKFLNNTNSYSIELNRNITSSKTVEINLGAQTVTYDGVDDFALVVLPATQIGLFKWDVGANDMDFIAAGGGSPSGTVNIIYRTTYN